MGEMASLWDYAEHHDMEQLGEKLLFTTLELEKLKAEAKEEMRKNREYVKQLIQLLKFAIHERDVARNQLQKLQSLPTIPHFQADSPLVKPGKPNSSITESNSLSDTYNYQSHDAVSSPEFSDINFQDSNVSFATNRVVPKIDQGLLIIDNLVKGRVLPQKGRLLEAVLEAGPLLQRLLLAGPLPRWRNPPQLQTFQIPPVSIKASDVEVFASTPLNSQPFAQMSCGSSQLLLAPTSNFANVASGTCLANASAVGNNGCVRLMKRQRFC